MHVGQVAEVAVRQRRALVPDVADAESQPDVRVAEAFDVAIERHVPGRHRRQPPQGAVAQRQPLVIDLADFRSREADAERILAPRQREAVLLLLVAVVLHQIGEAPHRDARRNGAVALRRHELAGGAASILRQFVQERRGVVEAEPSEIRFQPIANRQVVALDGADVQVLVAVVDLLDFSGRADARRGVDGGDLLVDVGQAHHRRIASQGAAVSATMLQTVQQVQHRVVFFPKQADGLGLLDRPVVECDGEVLARLDDDAEGVVVGLLRHQIHAALRRALHGVAAVDDLLFRIAAVLGRVLAGPVRARVLPRHDGLVHRHEVRHPERLRPGAAQQDLLERSPAGGDLAHDGVAHVREALVARRQLHVEGLEEGRLQLHEHRRDVAAAAVVRRRAGVHDVRHEGERVALEVREDDGAIQARIAIVLEGFAPVLDAGDQASRPRWQREHFVVADFEVREKERRFVVAPHLDQGALQVAVHPAAEWVVRGWSRIRQCLHHEIVGDAIAGHVAALGLGVEHRAFPEPVGAATQPLQQPIGTAGDVHDARNLGEAVVVDFDFQAFVRHALGQVRQAVWRTDWAEGVVVVLRRHAQLHRSERRRRMAPGVVVRVVVHHLGEALDGVAGGVENMAEVAEHGVARELAGDVAVRIEVVALGALAVDGAADVFVQVPLAARVADGKHLELARAIGIDVAQAGAGGVGDQVELAVEGMGAVVAEIGVSLPRASFGDAIAEVRVGPARVLLRIHAVAGEERAVDA